MEAAALFIAFFSFAAAAASAVFAGFQYVSAEKSAQRAERAESAARNSAADAISAYEKAADALVTMSKYAFERDGVTRAREDRARRLPVAAVLTRWAIDSIQGSMFDKLEEGELPSLAPMPPELRLLETELGDRSVEDVHVWLTTQLLEAGLEMGSIWRTGRGPVGGLNGLIARCVDPISEWVDDPVSFVPVFEAYQADQRRLEEEARLRWERDESSKKESL